MDLNLTPGEDPLRTPLLDPEESRDANVSDGTEDVQVNDDSSSSSHNEGVAETAALSSDLPSYIRIWNACILPEDRWAIRSQYVLLEGSFAVRLAKFIAGSLLGIVGLHFFWAHVGPIASRPSSTLKDFGGYELDLVIRDLVVFFVVGRLWTAPGIDRLSWWSIIILCHLCLEGIQYTPGLQQFSTMTWYDIIHCTSSWTIPTWIGISLQILLAALLILCQLRWAWNHQLLIVQGIETLLLGVFFVLPTISSPNFSLPYWFVGWFAGMHFRAPSWWSQWAMAWCMGLYLHGIALYGRKPILTCQYAYFLSVDNRCPFLECTTEEPWQEVFDNQDQFWTPISEQKCYNQG